LERLLAEGTAKRTDGSIGGEAGDVIGGGGEEALGFRGGHGGEAAGQRAAHTNAMDAGNKTSDECANSCMYWIHKTSNFKLQTSNIKG
jgi:hypothetical protein